MNITVSQNAVNAIPQMVSTLKSMGFPKLAVENCRTGIIAAIMRHFTSMNSKMPGYCHYDIPGRKYRFVFTYRMSPTHNMALITGVSIRKRPVENTGFPVNEEKRNVIRLTEEDLRRCVKETLKRVLNETFRLPHGLSKNDVFEKFAWKLSDLYLKGKITEDDHEELSHYFLYFWPNYANGYKEDKTKNKAK